MYILLTFLVSLAVESERFLRLRSTIDRLSVLINSEVLFFPETISFQIQEVARLVCRLSGAFTEVVMDLNVIKGLQKRETPINEVESCLKNLHSMKEKLLCTERALNSTPMPALRRGEWLTGNGWQWLTQQRRIQPCSDEFSILECLLILAC